MRILSIDYGTARVGTAMCDELEIVVSPLRVIPYTPDLIDDIAEIVREHAVGEVVVGMPYTRDGGESEIVRRIRNFIAGLRTALPCPVVEWDENYSSRTASMRMVESGMKKKKRQQKGTVDTWAAGIILQDYLASRQ